jgi:hypothetical protein
MILNIDAVISKTLRGRILDYLYSIYPKAISEDKIVKLFIGYYRQDEIIRALFYLCDRGYIKVIHDKPTFEYQITSKGIDVLYGDIEDKGVL